MDADGSGRARMRLPTADLPPDCAAPVTSESPWSGGPGGRSLNVCDRPRSIGPCSVRSVQLSRRSPSGPSSNAGRAGSARPDGSRARRPRTGRARRRGSACGSVLAPPPACGPAAGCLPSPRTARAAQSPCPARSAVRGPGLRRRRASRPRPLQGRPHDHAEIPRNFIELRHPHELVGTWVGPSAQAAWAAFQLREQVERAKRRPGEVEITTLGQQRHV